VGVFTVNKVFLHCLTLKVWVFLPPLQALENIEKAIDAHKPRNTLADLTSKFYTIIPHDFGRRVPPVISDKETLQKKFDLLLVNKRLLIGLELEIGGIVQGLRSGIGLSLGMGLGSVLGLGIGLRIELRLEIGLRIRIGLRIGLGTGLGQGQGMSIQELGTGLGTGLGQSMSIQGTCSTLG